MKNLVGYLYMGMTILLTVYGQLVVKWQVGLAGTSPEMATEKAMFYFRLVTNPWVLSAFVAAFIGSVFWMAVLTKLHLSYAFPPFVALSFVFVVAAGVLLFGEPITALQIVGLVLICAGVTVASLG